MSGGWEQLAGAAPWVAGAVWTVWKVSKARAEDQRRQRERPVEPWELDGRPVEDGRLT